MQLAIGDIISLAGWVVAIVTLGITIMRFSRDSSDHAGDDRERIVRIEANTTETRSDVADIKAELRSVRTDIGDHERRIIKLEADKDEQWARIDEHTDALGTITREHAAYHGMTKGDSE